jgi:hypothetical protein
MAGCKGGWPSCKVTADGWQYDYGNMLALAAVQHWLSLVAI